LLFFYLLTIFNTSGKTKFMSTSGQNNKKWIQSVAIALPLLLITVGWMGWRAKHHTLTQSPQNLSKSDEGASTSTQGGHDLNGVKNGSKNSQGSGSTVVGANGSSSNSAQTGNGGQVSGNGQVVGSTQTTGINGQVVTGTFGNGTIEGNGAVSGNGTSSADSKPVVTMETMKDGCFTLTFTHKAMATHASDDECSHHRNLIKLPRTDVHSSSVCIRVNGNPVRHEAVSGKAGEFVIGAVAGPKDVVTARFCVGKAKCSEGCPYPKQEAAKKDEFLEAISGGSNEDTGLAQWEATDAQKNNEVNQALDGDLKKAVEEQELASQHTNAGNSKLEIFKDWIGGEMAMACGSHQAAEPSRSTASVQVATSNGAQKPVRKQ
jgi:hypothetical protein